MQIEKYNRTTPETATVEPQNPAVLECRFCGSECPAELEELPCRNCKADTPFRFIEHGTPRNYRGILDSLGLRDRHIAQAFGYKDLGAFTSSTAARRIKAGVEFVYYAAFSVRFWLHFQSALKYFATICDRENVPVGIVVTDIGKFAVRFSISETVEVFDDFRAAANRIVEIYIGNG